MTVTIEIQYIVDSRIAQKAPFPLRGRPPAQVALDFWKQIKKEMSYRAKLEKVIMDDHEDITDLVRDLEESDWRSIGNEYTLPF